MKDYEDIISLMVSMIGISSKLFITKEQLNLFFVKYGLDRNEFGDLNKALYLTKPSLPNYPLEAYSLKTFQSYLLRQSSFLVLLKTLQQDISNFTLNMDEINQINIRRYYFNNTLYKNQLIDDSYDEEQQPFVNSKQPRESCMDRTFRLLCTVKPHPYHYDFNINTSSDVAINEILTQLKQRHCTKVINTSTFFKTSIYSKSNYEKEINHFSFRNRVIYPTTSSSLSYIGLISSPAKSKMSSKIKVFPSESE